jgi:HD-like signal output (HDOD) protein
MFKKENRMIQTVRLQDQPADIEQIIVHMPPLSTTVNKLLEICNDPHALPSEMAQIISLDPVLTGKVIQLINAVYYALPGRIGSLNRAIILLGINTVTNQALSTTILEKFSGTGTRSGICMDAFWAHSIGVGVTAKIIAVRLDIPRKGWEAYFVAGLLHDLGKIPLGLINPTAYEQITFNEHRTGLTSVRLEQRMLGMHHCSVGGMIAEKWRLGDALNDTLRHHHSPGEAAEHNLQITAIVALSDRYAREIIEGRSRCDDPGHHTLDRLIETIGISWPDLKEHRKTILAEIEKAQIFLRVSGKG